MLYREDPALPCLVTAVAEAAAAANAGTRNVSAVNAMSALTVRLLLNVSAFSKKEIATEVGKVKYAKVLWMKSITDEGAVGRQSVIKRKIATSRKKNFHGRCRVDLVVGREGIMTKKAMIWREARTEDR